MSAKQTAAKIAGKAFDAMSSPQTAKNADKALEIGGKFVKGVAEYADKLRNGTESLAGPLLKDSAVTGGLVGTAVLVVKFGIVYIIDQHR